ncbi:MAG TPA: hypothetical protein VGU43_04270 [Thermoplasmata archaeon]|nr:hypothetical protein [Thermoplasmata archaeon]
MAQLVLLRGANVGGNIFRPSELAQQLARWDVVSLGAAGTFVVRAPIERSQIESEIRRRLPFEAEMMTLSDRELGALLRIDPLQGRPAEEGVRRFAAAASGPVPTPPPLPAHFPNQAEWQVVLTGVTGKVAYGYRRRFGERLVYPNEALERLFRIPFTTRWWETLEQAHSKMAGDPVSRRSRPGASGRPGRARSGRTAPAAHVE